MTLALLRDIKVWERLPAAMVQILAINYSRLEAAPTKRSKQIIKSEKENRMEYPFPPKGEGIFAVQVWG